MTTLTKRSPDRLLAVLLYIVLGGAILFVARSVLIPLAFALLISFVLYPICAWLEGRGVSRLKAILLCVSAITIVLLAISLLVVNQVIIFSKEWPNVKVGMIKMVEQLSETLVTQLGVSKEAQDQWFAKAIDSFLSDGFSMFASALEMSAASAMMALLIPIYVVLILNYRKAWVYGLVKILPNATAEGTRTMLTYSIQAYYNFIKGMAIVYLIVGVLNSLGLYALGVPHALLFGILASLLTFIPYVGIMIGSLLPMTLAWAAHNSVWYPLGVVGIFAFVQYLEAYIIFPFAVSNRLQVNTLIILLAIFLGGLLWGVSGMILFIPFAGMLKLIADHDPRLKTLAIVLGAKQNVEEDTLESLLRKTEKGE